MAPLKAIANEAAHAAARRLHWEKSDWTVHVQRRIAVAMVRTATWIATRVPSRPRPQDQVGAAAPSSSDHAAVAAGGCG